MPAGFLRKIVRFQPGDAPNRRMQPDGRTTLDDRGRPGTGVGAIQPAWGGS